MWENSNKNALKIVENVCPYCGEHLIMNKRSFANHVRWCKQNPNYEKILTGTISKISGNKVERQKHILICENCGEEYEVFCTEKEFLGGRYKKTCSDICAKQLTNKKSGREKYLKVSQSLKKHYGTFNDDKEIGYKKICPHCKEEFSTDRREVKFCSRKCAREYRREKEIENWTEYQFYRNQCRFRFGIREFEQEFDFDLIRENGWYKAKNHGDNLNGVSRDHMFSIKRGYEMKIDPYLISHPANCKLLLQCDNFKKFIDCSITEQELLERVKKWNKKYGIYENKIDYQGIENFKR